jgi:hypothetical protein
MNQQNAMIVFDPIKAQTAAIQARIAGIVVNSDDTKKMATDLVKNSKDLAKKMKEARDELVAPAKKWIDEVDMVFKSTKIELDSIETVGKSKLLKYGQELAAEQQRIAAEAAAKRRKAEEEAAALRAREVTPDPAAPAPDDFGSLLEEKTDSAQSQILAEVEAKKIEFAARQEHRAVKKDIEATRVKGMKTVRKVRITNAAAIPRQFLVPDEVAIRKAALAGEIIAGVEVYEEQTLAV